MERLLTEEEWLIHRGLETTTKGFWLWARALELCKEDPSLQQKITRPYGLYETLSSEFNETPCRVERALRHACNRVGLHVVPKQLIGDYLLYLKVYNKKYPPIKEVIL